MRVTNSRRIALTRPAVDYEMFGPLGSDVYKAHKAAGTDRAAVIRCDCGDPFEFVDRAEQLRAAHGRKVESISLIQSFEKSELDPSSPEYQQLINDLGYLLAKALAPNSDVLVITHTDSAGGHGHNHIKILNHDNVTGAALRRDFRHFAVAEVNDDLMREHQLRVVERGSRDQTKYWEHVREGETITKFDLLLGDRLMAARLDGSWHDEDTWRHTLAAVGIEIKAESHTIKASADGATPEHESIGWTYRMLDDTRVDEGIKPRMRRRKASSIGHEFTHKAMQAEFEARQQQRAQQSAPQVQTTRPILFTEMRMGDHVSRTPSRTDMLLAGYAPAEINQLIADWEATQARVPGSAVADQPGLVQTAGISAEEASDDSPEPLHEARWPDRGHEADTERPERGQAEATQENGGLESAENASSAMGSTRSTTSTADAARSWPHSGHEVDTLRPLPGHDVARWPTAIDTEGPSAPAPVAPSSDAPALDEVEDQAGLAFAPAAASPSSDAPALDAESLPSAPAPAKPDVPYRSGVWSLADGTQDADRRAAFEAIARFDEVARLTLAEGGRIPTGDVPRGIGPRWLATYGDRLDPVVRYELRLRTERMAERKAQFETGKQLKDKLDTLGRRGDFVTDEDRDVESRLAASNAQVRLLEDRMRVGIYEAGSTWRPGRPVPPRSISASMQQRLHKLADATLDDHDSVDAPDQALGS